MVRPVRRISLAGAAAAAVVVWLVIAIPAGAAQLVVDALGDGVDASPGDGACRTAGGACTLRAAVQEADGTSAADTIVLPAGRLQLNRPLNFPLPSQTADLELDPANGDLDVSGTVTIRGAGADRTTIDAGGLDRAFDVQLGASAVISGLTITNGDATKADKTPGDIALGGAILNNGTLALARVALIGNRADGGGGVFTIPLTKFSIRDSLVANNRAVEGGGLRLDSGGLVLNTTITGNRLESRGFAAYLPDEITGYGGGIDHRGGDDVRIINSTITNNHAYKQGGGLNSGQDYAPVGALASAWPFRVYLRNTIISGNTADKGNNDCHVSAMVIQSLGHNLADDATCFLTAPGDLPRHDPQLGALADNGGPTQTQLPSAGSPVIDAGAAEDCPPADQRGRVRPQGSSCDIGAVEVVPARSRHCTTGRVVVITLPRRMRSARVTYHGRRARVTRRGGRLQARIVLRGLPAGHVVVRMRGRDGRGRLLLQTRSVETCTRRTG